MSAPSVPLLSVQNLTVRYGATSARPTTAVNDVSFSIMQGQSFGLVGESGCGKSTLAFGLMGLLGGKASVAGKVVLEGEDLLTLGPDDMAARRGRQLAMVFQAAMNALNPVIPVGRQIVEPMLLHRTVAGKEAAWERAAELFALVGLPQSRLTAYPHEMSGGQKQRAVLAMSLACGPRLLLADEPTTALDVVVQDQIFLRILELKRKLGLTVMVVSHDIGLIAETCEQVGVMYGGRLVETGPAKDVLGGSRHPYARALIRATPRVEGHSALVSLPGSPPDLSIAHPGCIFTHRCPIAVASCSLQQPPLIQITPEWAAACQFARDDVAGRVDDGLGRIEAAPALDLQGAAALVTVDRVEKTFAVRGTKLKDLFVRSGALRAVDKVSLTLHAGEALALVGESGSGKTTLGSLIAGLLEPTAGEIRFSGDAVDLQTRRGRRSFARRAQVVFQDPFDALNPRMTIGEIVGEPLLIHRMGDAPAREAAVVAALKRVGLAPAMKDRLPRQLSGGQRQRVAVARATVLRPEVLVADEPLSMLDTSVKAGILGLFGSFKAEGVSILLITHDISVTRHLCDRIAVMYLGSVVEIGSTEALINRPAHPYTKLLMESVPDLDRRLDPDRQVMEGEIPSAANKPAGCAFHTRCSSATQRCRTDEPPLEPVSGRAVACWHPDHFGSVRELEGAGP